ncbi:hypothetical protein L810_4519 [Burkholderia sp. AU4i]|uniref:hypothetical protein n=2 Tax=Burkholderia TaxID=32008 RepID=UPI000398D203|nr:hypothetical protein [Burkholderia sp. AU4i]ERJ33261.1 hypothetical protein L810_4519 [Burkholderia sp. AU4i]
MEHHFSLFPDDIFPVEKAITNIGGIEARAVDRFFRGRRRFAITLEVRDNYECDESACLGFIEPEAFAFFLPLFMKLAACEYDASNNIPDSVDLPQEGQPYMPWMRAIDAHFEMFGFKPGDRVYLRFNFDSRRVIITPDYNALNWREQPYGAAAQEEEEELEHAALAPLRRSVVW